MNLTLHPSVGVARLGNSLQQFCLSPDSIGGLPYEADGNGNKLGLIEHFKDDAGQIRRQGQPFTILQSDGSELTLNSPNVAAIEWTVHLANKKAAWYQYSELEGNLLYGQDNSYAVRKTPFRNPSTTDPTQRQQLIVDPGPRTVSGSQQKIGFDQSNVPSGYPASYPPQQVKYGTPITTLGDLLTDDEGRLIVLGGYGHAGGNEPLTSYGGSNTWHDDISDGPVYCTITFLDGLSMTLKAWVVVGSPDFAPEIVNISTLSDTMFDVAVRHFDLLPEMHSNGMYHPGYQVNYQRDILPIIQRIGRYQWVANVQSMSAFSSNIFDFSDNSPANLANRQNYFSYFRGLDDKSNPSPDQPQQQLFKEENSGLLPQMPMNSGSNSVSNETIEKFLALDETQYFMMSQWAKGEFSNGPGGADYPVAKQDQASVGNCVGLPMCPGIEVTWSVQNPNIYSAAYEISNIVGPCGYNNTGLSPSRDECESGSCEPGDLTKRMACPWQADFFQCTIQTINFSDPGVNKHSDAQGNQVPLPPTYYAYWWPPQSPWDVISGELTAEGQLASHVPAGQQMNYARGINSFVQMVEHWSALAFIRDSNAQDSGFPYFTETERNNELFTYKDVPVGQISGNSADDDTTLPVFYIEDNADAIKAKGERAKKMVASMEQRAFKSIEVVSQGLGMPRSGTRSRR